MSFVLVTDGRPGVQYKLNITPSTPLTEILSAACQKLKLSPEGRGLKRENKPLDLSLSYRLSGIPQGSRLLVYKLPKTTTSATVLVAVQLVESGQRIAQKYPITSSIWSILKAAEVQSKTEGKAINIIERAQPSAGKEGAGRLYYVRPVVQVLSRELSDLNDLALSLQQLGITKGTALLRVKFENTLVPLEQALEEIAKIFPEEKVEEQESTTPVEAEATPPATETPTSEKTKEGTLIDFGTDEPAPKRDAEMTETEERVKEEPTPFEGVSVFKPSESSTPQAALTQYNEEDYEVTVPLAKIHQAHLQEAGRFQRLPSDKEIEEQRREKNEKAKNSTLVVRIRFPDQMIVEKTFKGLDTATDLYEFVKTVLRFPEQDFSLYLSPPHRTIPRDTSSLFLKHGFSHRTLVNFVWKDTTPDNVKKLPALSDKFVDTAKDIPVPEEVEVKEDEDQAKKWQEENKKKPSGGGGGGNRGDGGVTKKLPKWLNLGRK